VQGYVLPVIFWWAVSCEFGRAVAAGREAGEIRADEDGVFGLPIPKGGCCRQDVDAAALQPVGAAGPSAATILRPWTLIVSARPLSRVGRSSVGWKGSAAQGNR